MVRVLDTLDGHLIIRRPSGKEVLNTRAPMPRRLGSASFVNKVVSFPQPPGTTLTLSSDLTSYRTNWPSRDQDVSTVDLGAYPLGMPAPDFLFWEIKPTLTGGGTILGTNRVILRTTIHRDNVPRWFQCGGGSMLAEEMVDDNDPPLGWRSWSLAVQSGRWVLETRHSNAAFNSGFSGAIRTMMSEYSVDINVEWGSFK